MIKLFYTHIFIISSVIISAQIKNEKGIGYL